MLNQPFPNPNPDAIALAEKVFNLPEEKRESEIEYLESRLEKAVWKAERDGKTEIAAERQKTLIEFRRLITPGSIAAKDNEKHLEKLYAERKKEKKQSPPVSVAEVVSARKDYGRHDSAAQIAHLRAAAQLKRGPFAQ